jgi:hypothetical protein
MKPYTLSVDIDVPRDLVIELFDDPDNLAMWQGGLVSWTLREGKQGQPGAIADIVFQHGKQRIKMVEEVTKRNLPDAFNGTYTWGGNSNTVSNRFIEIGPDKTRWELQCQYTMNTFMMKAMALLCSRKFKQQHLLFMLAFRAFCEDGVDVRTGEEG